MARTTAEIDGDSSGLVGALDKGKAGMQRMEAEGKKLSDQLKEVADDADKAAGAFIQRLGGPTAIKAIAGVGIAVTAAKELVGAFMESSEKLFQSYGEEGKKAWEETEKGLFAIKGAFAEALLGGRDLNENTARMNTLLSTTKVALDLLLSPLKLVADAMFALGDNTRDMTAYQRDLIEMDEKYKISMDQTRVSIIDTNKAYEDLTKTLGNMLRSRQEESAIRLQGLLLEIDTQRMANKEAKDFRANAEADAQAALVRADLLQSGLASKLEAAEHELTVVNDGVKQSNEENVARAREMLLADATFQRNLYQNQAAARKQAYENSTKMTEDEKKREEELLTQRENLVQSYEELRTFGEGGGSRPVNTPKASAAPPKVDPAADAIKAASDKLREAMAKSKEELEAAQKTVGGAFVGFLTGFDPTKSEWVDNWRTAADEVKGIYNDVVSAVTSGNQQIEQSSEVTLTKEQEAQKANYDQFVNQNAKMVAVSLAGGASIADAARAALGNIVTALGDKAMTQAAIEFATGNIAGAAALTAAGAAAYATGAYLGATDKKSGSATKATAKEAAVTNNQTNYNLRVDAAFADEESIARAFSKAQRLANTRYLGSAAY